MPLSCEVDQIISYSEAVKPATQSQRLTSFLSNQTSLYILGTLWGLMHDPTHDPDIQREYTYQLSALTYPVNQNDLF